MIRIDLTMCAFCNCCELAFTCILFFKTGFDLICFCFVFWRGWVSNVFHLSVTCHTSVPRYRNKNLIPIFGSKSLLLYLQQRWWSCFGPKKFCISENSANWQDLNINPDVSQD